MSNSFSSRIKELRTSLKLTQTEFASVINTTQAALSGYETGDRTPSYEVLMEIAQKFDISIDWLLGLSDKKFLDNLIITYDELFKLFINILETRYSEFNNRPIIDIVNADNESVVLTLHADPNIQQFFAEWCKVFELHCNNTIDDELYQLWIEKELTKYKNHKINGVPF